MRFIIVVLLLVLANATKAIQDQTWKRAGEKLIDLNQTPSPENSNESNQNVDLGHEHVVTSRDTSSAPKLKRQTRIQKLKQAFNNRSELDETDKKKVEDNLQNYRFKRRIQQSRRKKAMWERIRTGKATDSDLRAKASARKSHDKWMKANPEQVKESYRIYKQNKRKQNKIQ